MKMFKTTSSSAYIIEEVEVTRKTEKTVWIEYTDYFGKEQTEMTSRFRGYDQYFDTYQDAWEYLHEKAKEEVSKLSSWLRNAQRELENVEKLNG